MWRIRLVFPAGFEGGDIVINTQPACGATIMPGLEPCPKNQSNDRTATVTVEGGTEPEVTEKPVITWEANDETQEVVITVTGAGEIVLYNDDVEVARGESPLTYTVPYTDDPEGEEMGFSATAQEEGKEVSEYALATVEVPGKPQTIIKTAPLRRDIFFKINSTKIRPTETAKVADIANYLTENPDAKVVMTGYADKGTGNATINARLAAGRATAVKDMLVKTYNIPESRITYDSKGDTVQPFAENDKNRVTICIAE